MGGGGGGTFSKIVFCPLPRLLHEYWQGFFHIHFVHIHENYDMDRLTRPLLKPCNLHAHNCGILCMKPGAYIVDYPPPPHQVVTGSSASVSNNTLLKPSCSCNIIG